MSTGSTHLGQELCRKNRFDPYKTPHRTSVITMVIGHATIVAILSLPFVSIMRHYTISSLKTEPCCIANLRVFKVVFKNHEKYRLKFCRLFAVLNISVF
jgi:hypothetical protein